MKALAAQHRPTVHPLEQPGRATLYVGGCQDCGRAEFEGPRRRKPAKAMEDAQAHVLEHSRVTDWEATLIIRVAARTPKEALREMRRQLIRIATRHKSLEQSLREMRPIVTKLGS